MPFGVLVITGASNAVNLTDGLDGLAIGPAMIAAAAFAVIAYMVGNSVYATYLQLHHVPRADELMVFCAAMVGASLGFLWFNAPPASVFMGDTGSLSIGAALGAISIITKHELVLVIIGGLFVLEAVSVIVQVASFKSTGTPRLPHGAAAPSFRADGLGGAENRDPLLDHRRHPGHCRAGDAETAVKPMVVVTEFSGKRVAVLGLAKSGRRRCARCLKAGPRCWPGMTVRRCAIRLPAR